MLVIMYRFFDHLSFYLLEVIVHFQRANPGTMLLGLLIWPNYFYQWCFIKIARRVIYIEWLCFQCKAPFMKIFDLVTLWMMLSFWVALLSSLLMGPYNFWSWLFIFTQIRRITKFPLKYGFCNKSYIHTPSLVVWKIFKIQTVRKQGVFPVWTPDF